MTVYSECKYTLKFIRGGGAGGEAGWPFMDFSWPLHASTFWQCLFIIPEEVIRKNLMLLYDVNLNHILCHRSNLAPARDQVQISHIDLVYTRARSNHAHSLWILIQYSCAYLFHFQCKWNRLISWPEKTGQSCGNDI